MNRTNIIKNTIGSIITIISIMLAGVWFGWELSLVIFLALYGNNLERSKDIV